MKGKTVPILLAALLGGLAVLIAVIAFGASLGSVHTRSGSDKAPSAGASVAAATANGSRRQVSSTELTATQIYQRDSGGVVAIRAVTADGEDLGTGIVLNEEGLILTNDHVIAGASSIVAGPGTSPKTTRTATVVGEEANQDLALIKIDPSGLGLHPLSLVSSKPVQIGDPVYAIGNPYGLDETLTKGIVSALGRTIDAPDGTAIEGALQTDAALNPGNSGGPLLNDEGFVIGVNSQIASDAARSEGSQPGSTGVGFAISSNTAASVIKKIEAGEGVSSSSGAVSGTRSVESGTGEGAQRPYGQASPYGEAEGSGGSAGESGGTEGSPYGLPSEGSGSSEAVVPGGSVGGAAEAESGADPYGESGRTVIVP